MENLKRLQEGNKRNMSFKQAFFQLGMTGFNNYPGAIMYDWPEEMKHETLNVGAITDSMIQADAINLAKTQEGSFIPAQ